MKINIDKNLVDFKPENDSETEDLQKLWNFLVGCVTDSKKLMPVGEYSPSKENKASFFIEGLHEKEVEETEFKQDIAPVDAKYYCARCNKLIDVKAGEKIPTCCGIPMEYVD